MKRLVLLAPVLSLLLLAAHFVRAQLWLPAVISVALIGLLALRAQWSVLALQCCLVLGSIEWLRTLLATAAARIAMGQPYTRMALILGVVAALTFASALVFQLPVLRQRNRLDQPAQA
jgi:hypothetical protein